MTVAELNSKSTVAVFHNILVATDFSASSRRALVDALALPSQGDVRLCVAHVRTQESQHLHLENPPTLNQEQLEDERPMKAFVGNLDPEHKIKTVFLPKGAVAEMVTSLIRESEIDLLVIGTRGRGGIRKLAVGSVAEELLRVAPCPVLTIGPKVEVAATKSREFRRILFATDFGNGSAKALPLAVSLARAEGSKLILLHMLPPMPTSTGNFAGYAPAAPAAEEIDEWWTVSHKKSMQKLKACLPPNAALAADPEYVVGTEFLPEGILTAAVRLKVDLIVMGANRAHSPRTAAHIPWAIVHEVVRNAPCPVLTVVG
jgi:nucleotide-binding universal stress UspA family protein